MIDSKDVSVVVQGAVGKNITAQCLNSVRRYLPQAEIILSTWEGSDITGLDYDILVLNKDPGGVKHDYMIWNADRCMNNFNRQLISTQNGLKKAQRKYSLKLRSDLILKNANFLNHWEQFKRRDVQYKVFEHRVLTGSLFAREYSCQSGTGSPTPFHPSDFWLFGLTCDLKNYFLDCPMQTPEEGGNWRFKYPNRVPYCSTIWRFSPEQFFCVHWIKKYYPDLQFEDWSDWNEANIALSNSILYNNFIFLGYEESGIFSKKYAGPEAIKFRLQGLITYAHFQERYKEYCDPDHEIKENAAIYKLKLIFHLTNVVRPLREAAFWLKEILAVGYFSLLALVTACKLEKKG